MEQSDEQIMLDYKAGRKQAAQTIYLRYKYRVLNFSWRMLGNRGEAEDVSTEVFMSLFTNAYEPQSGVKFSTWLYTVARNKCIDVIRNRSRFTNELSAEQTLEHLDPPAVARDDLAQKETGDQVRLAIQKLPDQQKEVILLQHYEGLSYTEISEVMGCSLDNVKILIYRAKENLKKQLAFLIKEGGQ